MAQWACDVRLSFSGRDYRVELDKPISLAIELDFKGPQPRLLALPPAQRQPVALDGFLGALDQGGPCNCDEVRLIPHCQGTHTETVSHIVRPLVAVGRTWQQPFCPARLISLEPALGSSTGEHYRPALNPSDWLITAENLQRVLQWKTAEDFPAGGALMIRTRPNPMAKRFADYADSYRAPFFTLEAIEWLDAIDVGHLLVDFPSIDRRNDQGLLTNHHLFWRVPAGTREWVDGTRTDRTVTELIYVPDEIPDGWYALTVQVPAWLIDAAPSRPLIFPLQALA